MQTETRLRQNRRFARDRKPAKIERTATRAAALTSTDAAAAVGRGTRSIVVRAGAFGKRIVPISPFHSGRNESNAPDCPCERIAAVERLGNVLLIGGVRGPLSRPRSGRACPKMPCPQTRQERIHVRPDDKGPRAIH